MDLRHYSKLMADNEAMIDKIIWVQGALREYTMSEDLFEFFENLDPIDDPNLWKECPWLQPLCVALGPEISDEDALTEELTERRFDGFLVHVKAPVREYISQDQSVFQLSWSYCHIGWVYGETLDIAFGHAVTKVQGWAEVDRARPKESIKLKEGKDA